MSSRITDHDGHRRTPAGDLHSAPAGAPPNTSGVLTKAEATKKHGWLPPNVKPVADAGGPYTLLFGASVALDGSGSNDPDGGTIVDYAWSWTGGSASGVNPTISGIDSGSYSITLTVTDDRGGQHTDTATLTVFEPSEFYLPSLVGAFDPTAQTGYDLIPSRDGLPAQIQRAVDIPVRALVDGVMAIRQTNGGYRYLPSVLSSSGVDGDITLMGMVKMDTASKYPIQGRSWGDTIDDNINVLFYSSTHQVLISANGSALTSCGLTWANNTKYAIAITYSRTQTIKVYLKELPSGIIQTATIPLTAGNVMPQNLWFVRTASNVPWFSFAVFNKILTPTEVTTIFTNFATRF